MNNKGKIKIAVIAGRGLNVFSGLETYVNEIYPRLSKKGHKISVFSYKKDHSCPN